MFGAKGDWKRHENSQHHRLESWKCNVPIGPTEVCRSVHYRKENFVNHLKSTTHSIKNETEIKKYTEDSYIGGSGHHTFWCGFCTDENGRGRIVRMKAKGLPGWEERFDHIGDHFDHGEHIRTYVYQDAIDPCPSMSDSEDDNEPTPEPAPPLYRPTLEEKGLEGLGKQWEWSCV